MAEVQNPVTHQITVYHKTPARTGRLLGPEPFGNLILTGDVAAWAIRRHIDVVAYLPRIPGRARSDAETPSMRPGEIRWIPFGDTTDLGVMVLLGTIRDPSPSQPEGVLLPVQWATQTEPRVDETGRTYVHFELRRDATGQPWTPASMIQSVRADLGQYDAYNTRVFCRQVAEWAQAQFDAEAARAEADVAKTAHDEANQFAAGALAGQ